MDPNSMNIEQLTRNKQIGIALPIIIAENKQNGILSLG